MLRILVWAGFISTAASGAPANELSGEALSLLIFGPGAAEKLNNNTFVIRKDECKPNGKVRRCTRSTETLTITGKCTAERRLQERLHWENNDRDDAANFIYSVTKYDFSKAATFGPIEAKNKQDTISVFFNYSGDKGVACTGELSEYGKKVSAPSNFFCYPTTNPGSGGSLDVTFLGVGPAVMERARKAADYYRANSCAGKPF